MSDYNTLEQKLEGAAKDVLDDDSGWTIPAYTGEDDEDIGTPRVVCMVASAAEGPRHGQAPRAPDGAPDVQRGRLNRKRTRGERGENARPFFG